MPTWSYTWIAVSPTKDTADPPGLTAAAGYAILYLESGSATKPIKSEELAEQWAMEEELRHIGDY
jgi:hypothetical protein